MDKNSSSKKIKISSDKAQEVFQHKLKEIKIKEKEEATQKKAASLGLPYINLVRFPISDDALRVIDLKKAEEGEIVCFFYGDRQLRLGAVNPFAENTQEIIKEIKDRFFNKEVAVYLISDFSLEEVLRLYRKLPQLKEEKEGIEINEESLNKFKEIKDFRKVKEYIQHVSLTEILNLILGVAINIDASDIHIEAEKEVVRVRFRIDGILYDVVDLPKDKWKVLVSRIKLVSGLKINIDNRPQDGRLTVILGGNTIDIRVSTIPTAYGESVVIRILQYSRQALTLKDVGLSNYDYKILEKAINRPNGMILNTGPTGSGKTTTLYAILNKLNTEGIKIITIEDPIEYRLSGINQSQVDQEKGYTFARALKSIVRQDPDIIMVGEIRDTDTVETAINAALTGHLVLSTVHTNSAAGAVPRLLALGAKNFLLSPALNLVIGQRLVRRLCPYCKKERKLTPEEIKAVRDIFVRFPERLQGEIDLDNLENITFYKSQGCEKCGGIGYKGRVGIFELIDFDEEIRGIIISKDNVSEDEIRKTAIKKGMSTIAQDGVLKATKGITSLEEVFRVAV